MKNYLVLLLAVGLGVLFVLAVANNPNRQRAAKQQAQQRERDEQGTLDPESSESESPEPESELVSPEPESPEAESSEPESPEPESSELLAPTPAQPAASTPASANETATDGGSSAAAADTDPIASPLGELRVAPAETPGSATLGGPGYTFTVDLSRYGAAVRKVEFTRYFADGLLDPTVSGPPPGYVVIEPVRTGDKPTDLFLYPFAARSVRIADPAQPNAPALEIDLQNTAWDLVEQSNERATYVVTIVDEQQQPILEVRRTYAIQADNYEITLDQRVINRTDRKLRVSWSQNLQGDMPRDTTAYLGDKRDFVAGYFNLDFNPSREFIYVKNTKTPRATLIDHESHQRITDMRQQSQNFDGGFIADALPMWPNEDLPSGQVELVWLAAENRYFAVVVHRPVRHDEVDDGAGQKVTKRHVPALDKMFPSLSVQVLGQPASGPREDNRAMVLIGETDWLDLPAGGTFNADLAVFAGPEKIELLTTPPYSELFLKKLIVYELGCTWCTFQPIARGMLTLLKWFHSVTFDWGVAIILLVLVVRLILHPITKQAQINMTKFSKQMAELQPEMEKLKKKYGDNQAKIQQEQAKLMRERGINPAGLLGCLPMFLQTPIWIALYAMLYFAIELRHEPAFWGVFQAISGGHWAFLGDLSSPDRLIVFFNEPQAFTLIFLPFDYSSFNVLPILWAVTMYINQKLTQPPPTNEQMAQQQQMMKFMYFLFPIFLYSAPSGLTLYMLASTAAGIIDSWIVRQHIKKQEADGTLFQAKPPKPGGIVDRLMRAFEEAQTQAQSRTDDGDDTPRGGASGGGGGASGGGGGRKGKRRRK